MDEWRARMAQTHKIITMSLFLLLAVCQLIWAAFGGPGPALAYFVIAFVFATAVVWQLSMRRGLTAGHDETADER
jgi:membrane protein YdbS with pleckstrin-like domain